MKKSGNQKDDAHDDSILARWQITPLELTKCVDDNPSLRGMLFGYVAELKLSEFLDALDDVTGSMKYDDHDRTKKGDRVITYKGQRIVVESKSLQTNSVKFDEGRWTGKAQVDASDRRMLTLPDGSQVNTTLLLAGEFDVLAVNTFAFESEWKFVFAKNEDLPRTSHSKYKESQRRHLLASLVKITWPPEPPFRDDIIQLVEEIIASRPS